jgi:hypothetical protein
VVLGGSQTEITDPSHHEAVQSVNPFFHRQRARAVRYLPDFLLETLNRLGSPRVLESTYAAWSPFQAVLSPLPECASPLSRSAIAAWCNTPGSATSPLSPSGDVKAGFKLTHFAGLNLTHFDELRV